MTSVSLTFFPRSGLAEQFTTNTVSDDVSDAMNRTFMTAPTRKQAILRSLPGTDVGTLSPYLCWRDVVLSLISDTYLHSLGSVMN